VLSDSLFLGKLFFQMSALFSKNWIGINTGSHRLSGIASAAAICATLKLLNRDMRENICA
jgi:hypothetical protein